MNTIKAKAKIILRVMMTGKPHRTRGNICLWKSFENDSWNGSRVSGISTGTMQDENTARKCTACAPHGQVGFRKSRAQHHSLIEKNDVPQCCSHNHSHKLKKRRRFSRPRGGGGIGPTFGSGEFCVLHPIT